MNLMTSCELEAEEASKDLRQLRWLSTSLVHCFTSISAVGAGGVGVRLSDEEHAVEEARLEGEEEEEIRPRKMGMLLLLDSSRTDLPSCSSRSSRDSWRSSRSSRTSIAAEWSEVVELTGDFGEGAQSVSELLSSRPPHVERHGESHSSSFPAVSFIGK